MAKGVFQKLAAMGSSVIAVLIMTPGIESNARTAAAQQYGLTYGLCLQIGDPYGQYPQPPPDPNASMIFDVYTHRSMSYKEFQAAGGQLGNFQPKFELNSSKDGQYNAYFSNPPMNDPVASKTLTIETSAGVRAVSLNGVTPLNSGLRWSPDSKRIAYLSRVQAAMNEPDTALIIVGIDGNVKQLPLPHLYNDAYIDWSPDNQWLMYTDPIPVGETYTLISPDENVARTFNPQLPRSAVGYVYNWSPDGKVIVFPVPDLHTPSQLRYVLLSPNDQFGTAATVNTGALFGTSSTGPNAIPPLVWAPRGHSFAEFLVEPNPAELRIQSNVLMIVDTDTTTVSTFNAPPHMSFGPNMGVGPYFRWSPDGRNVMVRVATAEDQNPTLYIYGKDTPADGIRVAALPDFGPPGSPINGFASFSQAWSADGRGLYYLPVNHDALAEYHLDSQQTDQDVTPALGPEFEATSDQKYILFDLPQENENMFLILDTQNNEIEMLNNLFEKERLVRPLYFTTSPWLHGDQLNVITKQEAVYRVELIDLATHQRQVVHDNLIQAEEASLFLPLNDYFPSFVQVWWRSADGSAGFDAYNPLGTMLYQIKVNVSAQIGSNDIQSSWPPNHERAAFIIDHRELQIVGLDDSAPRMIASLPPLPDQAQPQVYPISGDIWSPDGSLLAFEATSQVNGVLKTDVKIVTADGSLVTQLENLPHTSGLVGYSLTWQQCVQPLPNAPTPTPWAF